MIVGMCVPFHELVRSPNGGLWRFMPGAFARADATPDVRLILNHVRSSPVIASTCDPDRPLCLWETADALLFRYTPVGVIGATVLRHALRGAYVGVSIGFKPGLSTACEADGVVSFTDVHLVEISLVPCGTMPAFASTWVRVMTQTDLGRWEWAA